jgi:2,4-dienoyl-CoA reductase-like NADH-dependent reductase (Old Yellow Enzyme family)
MPTDRYRLYHVEKAKGGIGMTMTAGSAVVAEDSPPAFGNLHAYRDEIVPWLRRMTREVHEHGAACMIQLTHLGRRTGWAQDDWLPVVAPSPLREPAHRSIPKEAEDWDIERIVGKYADAAERMQAAGMDGIEIESYGHLFDQFWSPLTNHRTDGRRLVRASAPLRWEVLRAIREQVGFDYIVGLRMTVDEHVPGGIDTATGVEILGRLEADRLIDFVNVIRGTIASESELIHVIPIHGMPSAPHLDFAGQVRASTGLAVLHASKVDDVATARHAIREGRVDLVGMTRAHLADPHLVRKVLEGRETEIRPCVGATYCLDRIYAAGEALCIHNAATSREETMPHDIPRASEPRRIVVVGAGPAGLEAARVAGERGHCVTVLEAMPWAGGQIRLAARNPRRRDLMGIVEWRVAELERLSVDVRYDALADDRDVLAPSPTSSSWPPVGCPSCRSWRTERPVVTSWDVLGGDVAARRRALFDDNGTHSALSAGELIARSGARLEIVTPERMLGVEVGGMNHVPYARAFNETDTRISLNQKVLAVRPEAGRLCVDIGSEQSPHRVARHVDQVVVDYGTAASADLYFELKPLSSNRGAVDYGAARRPTAVPGPQPDGAFQLFRIGDCVVAQHPPPSTTPCASSRTCDEWAWSRAIRSLAPGPRRHGPGGRALPRVGGEVRRRVFGRLGFTGSARVAELLTERLRSRRHRSSTSGAARVRSDAAWPSSGRPPSTASTCRRRCWSSHDGRARTATWPCGT